jgi:hypothetical protein
MPSSTGSPPPVPKSATALARPVVPPPSSACRFSICDDAHTHTRDHPIAACRRRHEPSLPTPRTTKSSNAATSSALESHGGQKAGAQRTSVVARAIASVRAACSFKNSTFSASNASSPSTYAFKYVRSKPTRRQCARVHTRTHTQRVRQSHEAAAAAARRRCHADIARRTCAHVARVSTPLHLRQTRLVALQLRRQRLEGHLHADRCSAGPEWVSACPDTDACGPPVAWRSSARACAAWTPRAAWHLLLLQTL